MDSRALAWTRHSVEGKLFLLARAKAGALGGRAADRRSPSKSDGARARVDPAVGESPRREIAGAHQRLRIDVEGERRGEGARVRVAHSAGPAPRVTRRRRAEFGQELWGQFAI